MLVLIRKLLLFALTVFVLTPVSTLVAQPSHHFWNRTSGLPGWHSAGNWNGGLPSSSDYAYFRNSTNGTVYITQSTGVLNTIKFNDANNFQGGVYAKFRGDPGLGLYANNIIVGGSAIRNAFVDLDRGTHRATDQLYIWPTSRLDVHASSTVVAPMFTTAGITNLNGGQINATDFKVAGAIAVLNANGGEIDTANFSIESGGTVNWNSFVSDSLLLAGSLSNYGTLTVESAGRAVTNNATLSGTTTVSGIGSYLYVTQDMYQSGPLHVDNLAGLWVDGTSFLDSGITRISNNSYFETSGIKMGYASSGDGGTLLIDSGADANTLGFAHIGGPEHGSTATVTGLGSSWTADSFWIGYNYFGTEGSGILNVQDRALVSTGFLALTEGSLNLGNDATIVADRVSINGGTAFNHDGGELIVNGGKFTDGYADFTIGGASPSDHATITLRNGASWIRSQSIYVGEAGDGTLNVINGSVAENIQTIIGLLEGVDGYTTISGTDSRLDVNGIIQAGRYGNGTLAVMNGGGVSSNRGEIAERAASTSIITVDGNGSNWDITKVGTSQQTNGNLLIGEFGNGTLNITNGGTVSNITAAIATQSGSTGSVTVNGAGSTWNNSGNLLVGNSSGGSATLNIENMGVIEVMDNVTVGTNGTINLDGGTLDAGTIELEGAAVFAMNGGLLKVDNFVGDISQNGGILAPGDSPGLTSIDGDYAFNAGTIQLEIGGLLRETDYDAIDVTGLADLNGMIGFSFINGFTARAGDQFDFLDATSFSGLPIFDFSSAELANGLSWNTENFLVDGSLSISAVPEPSSLFLIGALAAGMVSIRRRS